MPVNTNNINEIRVGVLGYSVDESASGGLAGSGQWISTGPGTGRTTLNALSSGERIFTRILNAMDTQAVLLQSAVQAFDQRLAGFTGAYSEDFTASIVWTIPHNLNEQYVLVQVVNDSGNTVIPDIEYTTADICTLRFVKPTAGTVRIRK